LETAIADGIETEKRWLAPDAADGLRVGAVSRGPHGRPTAWFDRRKPTPLKTPEDAAHATLLGACGMLRDHRNVRCCSMSASSRFCCRSRPQGIGPSAFR